jgi:hypothetical protein
MGHGFLDGNLDTTHTLYTRFRWVGRWRRACVGEEGRMKKLPHKKCSEVYI